MRMKITHYGYPDDPTPDKYTRAGVGALGWLRKDSCALTVMAQHTLYVPPRGKLKIVWDDGYTEERFFDDRAPETEPRLDCYRPDINNKLAVAWPHGEYAEVTFIPLPEL